MTSKAKTPTAAPFCWYELVTTNPKAATTFYKSVFGWTAKGAGQTAMDYTLLSAKEHMIAGLMAINEEMKQRNVPPCWTGYVAVPDTDAYVKKVVAAGGKLHRPAADIPGVGRFALVTDPHGAAFFLFTPMGENPNPPPASGTPGTLVGMNSTRAISRLRSSSIPSSSAGRNRRRSTWGRWAPISFSPSTARTRAG